MITIWDMFLPRQFLELSCHLRLYRRARYYSWWPAGICVCQRSYCTRAGWHPRQATARVDTRVDFHLKGRCKMIATLEMFQPRLFLALAATWDMFLLGLLLNQSWLPPGICFYQCCRNSLASGYTTYPRVVTRPDCHLGYVDATVVTRADCHLEQVPGQFLELIANQDRLLLGYDQSCFPQGNAVARVTRAGAHLGQAAANSL